MELIAYYRVSTQRQGQSGLGLEAQQAKVAELASARGDSVVAEFTELESGRKQERPVLAEALAEARKRKAGIIVAKLDRLARDCEFILRLAREAETNGLAGFVFADLPDVDATTSVGKLVLTVMASVAEFEARRISERTREALAAAKARGVKLGGLRPNVIRENKAAKDAADARAEALRAVVAPMVAQGLSLTAMAKALASAGTTTRSGGPLSASQVKRLVERLGLQHG